jgi:hypothetical protein
MNSSAKKQRQEARISKKIKVEGEADQGREVAVRFETVTVESKIFASHMVMWRKIYSTA